MLSYYSQACSRVNLSTCCHLLRQRPMINGNPQLGACTFPYAPLSISYALLYKLRISIISYCSASWELQLASIPSRGMLISTMIGCSLIYCNTSLGRNLHLLHPALIKHPRDSRRYCDLAPWITQSYNTISKAFLV